MQIPGPHLPKSSNDYVKRFTLSRVNRKGRVKMLREELVYLKLGRHRKESRRTAPLKMGEGKEKKRRKKKKSATT